eukprot:12466793-Alexandrium_andersonii.AAC.1
MQHRLRCSELGLRDPRHGLIIGSRSSRWGAFCAVVRADPNDARCCHGGSEGLPRGFQGASEG